MIPHANPTIHTNAQPLTFLRYADALQRLLYDQIGFLPRVALAEYHARGQIRPALENGDPCGYLLWYDGRNGNRPRRDPWHLHIHQAAISYDVQRRQHGTALVKWLLRRASRNAFRTIGCWVASDIPANAFWRDLGFEHIATRIGGRRRNRLHNLWMRPVQPPGPDRLRTSLPIS